MVFQHSAVHVHVPVRVGSTPTRLPLGVCAPVPA